MRGVWLILMLTVLVLADARGADEWWLGVFRGRMVMESRDYEKVVELTVAKPKGGGAVRVTGGYWYAEEHALAPDFEGDLISSDKTRAKFSFLDSYANEGTLTLTRDGNGVVLSIKIATVKNARCLLLYDPIRMRRF